MIKILIPTWTLKYLEFITMINIPQVSLSLSLSLSCIKHFPLQTEGRKEGRKGGRGKGKKGRKEGRKEGGADKEGTAQSSSNYTLFPLWFLNLFPAGPFPCCYLTCLDLYCPAVKWLSLSLSLSLSKNQSHLILFPAQTCLFLTLYC